MPIDMDAIDLEDYEDMQGRNEELDEEEDGLSSLDEDGVESTDETDDDSDTDSTGGSVSSEMDESEDGTNGAGLEDTKPRMTPLTSMTLGLFETYRTASTYATVATSIPSRRSSFSSELSVSWSNINSGDENDDNDEETTLLTEATPTLYETSSAVTAPIRSSPFETPLLETIITFEAIIPDEDDSHNIQMAVESIWEENLEDKDKLDKDKETHSNTTDEGDAVALIDHAEHTLEQAIPVEVNEDAKAITSPPSSFIASQERHLDMADDEETNSTLLTNIPVPGSLNTSDQTNPTSPYSVWPYPEEATQAGPTSRAPTSPLRTHPEDDTAPSSPLPSIAKTVCSGPASSDLVETPSSPMSPPPYVATQEQVQEMKSKSIVMPIKITATRPTVTRLVSRSLKARMSSALRSGFSTASRATSLTLFAVATPLEGDAQREMTQDEPSHATSGLELEVLRLQAEITVLHERIDRLEMDRHERTPANKRNGPGPLDRNTTNNKTWTVRGVVVMVLKKGLVNAVLIIVAWVVCYKRQQGLQLAAAGWRYLKRTKQRWIQQASRR
ncbi:hypothetical protein CPC16_005992 [Podila verticillata]|nr:hypothetical protein CPC16_005992 [Podila verticillata]